MTPNSVCNTKQFFFRNFVVKETRAKDWGGTKDSLSKWGDREVLCLFWIFTKGEAPAAGIADENGMVENQRLRLQGRGVISEGKSWNSREGMGSRGVK